jgi:hypothetical protein
MDGAKALNLPTNRDPAQRPRFFVVEGESR